MNYNVELNKPQSSLTPFSAARRPYPQFVSTTYWRNNGAANYNSFNFGVRRKVGQVTFDGGWTWASNYSDYLANNSQTSVAIENPYAPLAWGRDPLTAKQRVVGSVVWDLPFGKNRQWLANAPAVARLYRRRLATLLDRNIPKREVLLADLFRVGSIEYQHSRRPPLAHCKWEFAVGPANGDALV